MQGHFGARKSGLRIEGLGLTGGGGVSSPQSRLTDRSSGAQGIDRVALATTKLGVTLMCEC